ncbi:MAG: glycosyltransferase [Desulfobacteraceae bacterium]|nr:glycosyltransferase [Desulfobacteraceae bacterium]
MGSKDPHTSVPILYVIGSLDIGGSEKQLYLLLKYLDRKRFRPLVVSLSEGGYWIRPIEDLGVEVICLQRHSSFEVKRLISLLNIIKEREPAIVHSYQPPANKYAALAAMIGRSEGKLIISRRGLALDPGSNQIVKRGLDDLVYRSADAVVCNSKSLQQDLKERFKTKLNTVVIPNGMECFQAPASGNGEASLKINAGFPADSLVVGTVGRLVPFKNHSMFLEIASEVVKKVPRAHFAIIGDGPMLDELQRYAAQLGIDEHVNFMGRREDVPQILPAMDLFLFTSIKDQSGGEGFPNAVMEAMMCGLPCVVSNVGGTRELFNNGEAGYMVDADSKGEFVRKAVKLLRDKPLREKMGARGREIILGGYSAEEMSRRFEELYDYVLIGRPQLAAAYAQRQIRIASNCTTQFLD